MALCVCNFDDRLSTRVMVVMIVCQRQNEPEIMNGTAPLYI